VQSPLNRGLHISGDIPLRFNATVGSATREACQVLHRPRVDHTSVGLALSGQTAQRTLDQSSRFPALIGQTWTDQTELWAGLDERREVLNTQLPTRCLDGQAPLEAYPTARQAGRAYQPQWEEELLDVDRVYAYLARGRWFRQVRANGSMRIGGYYYALGRQYADRTTEITFVPATASFLCRPEGTDHVLSVPAQGLTR